MILDGEKNWLSNDFPMEVCFNDRLNPPAVPSRNLSEAMPASRLIKAGIMACLFLLVAKLFF